MGYFCFNLNEQLIILFNTSAETMAWITSALFLVAFINTLLIPVWRTMISNKVLVRYYFFVWFIAVVLQNAALFLKENGFSLWIAGFLLAQGVAIIGTKVMIDSLFADYATDNTKLPRVFSAVVFLDTISQLGSYYCELSMKNV